MNQNKKEIHINLIVLIVVIVLIIVGIRITMARYASQGQTTTTTDVAFYILKDSYQEGSLVLDELSPSNDTYDYQFTVANFEGNKVAETSIDYEVELDVTTNLPLEFKVYKNNTLLTSTTDREIKVQLDDSRQSYIRKIIIKKGTFKYNEKTTDTYKLEVTFPLSYNQYEEFEGMIDNINIKVDAKQKTD